jgi:hypothetical protein
MDLIKKSSLMLFTNTMQNQEAKMYAAVASKDASSLLFGDSQLANR